MRQVWAWVIGSITGIIFLFRAVFVRRIRLTRELASILYELIQVEGRSFVLDEEASQRKPPLLFDALCILSGIPFRFHIEERLLRAGMMGVESISTVLVFRWQADRLLALALSRKTDAKIPIYILQRWDAEKIGSIEKGSQRNAPYLEPDTYLPFEKSVAEVIANERLRTSALIYGPPGNGKSQFARYIALKYEMPIYIVSFVPDMNNHDVIRMFGHLEGPCIVLLEDFDNYFDRRKPLMQDMKFTYDAILNVLDGAYASLNRVVVIMTTNDIDKIDAALKERPSRLRHVIEMPNPPEAIRARVFAGHKDATALVAETGDWNLDQILALSETKKEGDECPRV